MKKEEPPAPQYSVEISVKYTSLTSNPFQYPHYLPIWDHGEKHAPLQPFTHTEHGLDADPTFKDLLPEGSTIKKLTPTTGSEVTGVQLSNLSPAGKDQLARLVAQRKVVAFRDQDFAKLSIQEAMDFGGYFGRHHIHPTSGAPEGYPEIHLVYRNGSSSEFDSFLANRNSSVAWHSDVTYEQQPPGTTFLYILDGPEVGGDTAFVNQVEAYNRLSQPLKQRLHGLKAVHSGIEQAEGSRERGGVVRREPVTNEHPIVRTHPVTGEKALFVNSQCETSLVVSWTKDPRTDIHPISHAQHRRLQERRKRSSPRLLVQSHRSWHRLPSSRAMVPWHSCCLGCEFISSPWKAML